MGKIIEDNNSRQRPNNLRQLETKTEIMEAIEFACVIDNIAKSFKIDIDSDLVAAIYQKYESTYDNYTLLELIHLLSEMNVEIDCMWNKKAIIQMIEERDINIPSKLEPLKPTTYRYNNELTYDYIETLGTKFKFSKGCIIQSEYAVLYELDVTTTIELISDDLPEDDPESYHEVGGVTLIDRRDDSTMQLSCQEFIDMLDYDDVSIVQNISYGLYLFDEDEAHWSNEVRYL